MKQLRNNVGVMLAIVAASCSAATPESTETAETVEQTGSEEEPSTRGTRGPCSGSSVDLREALAARECEEPCGEGPARENLAARIESRLDVTPASVEGGDEVDVRVSYRNRSDSELKLSFIAHEGPMFTISATNPEGQRVGDPDGPPPLAEGEVFMPGAPYPICITLEPGGEAYVEGEWSAIQWRWAPQNGRARPPTVEPDREPVGPLPPGRYQMHMGTMLQDEGDFAQPSAWIEVVAP